MRVDDFDFDLPRQLIADRPAEPRDAARLLEVEAGGLMTGPELTDWHVRDLPGLLKAGDVLVVNDTRVIPARLRGKRGLAGVEIMLHQPVDAGRWRAFARPAKKLSPGDTIVFAEDFTATVIAKGEGGDVEIAFNDPAALADQLQRHGEIPLPPYIDRPDGPDARDLDDYQTMFAAHDGAVAAPTAGLHFTPALLDALTARGVETVRLTLHVGAGTFLPVKSETVEEHVMHAERGVLTAEAAARINAARAAGGRVVAVGTTSLRLLESAAGEDGAVHPFTGSTAIFITPGHRFRVVDLLVTNFHLPRSTLFMLVCAFAGTEWMKQAYAHAIATGYRFYSYGDTSLLHRQTAP
ncbi:S-adenosylmethionine:tRNA ribosyltransferase-isomerase [Inquilinus ginsengisoli]|uniref:S-adenosylmethionine:tRNA ribosyltransferase-isomerase n=1 Tax=Inquilinus ginsengisoli TaxID=363840 RepID=A0ABU1JSS7_9PROT|nr:tRNA preQ1(34) S-adenosylmethionine ribosyltransferase-isomerase QueA [Inquilinus ginsengisoli]MDR6291327.1 S-adenosylmethionine:tRNA ribosyltransferase-isomerase [Inquilinus ginsengisoli]